MNCWEELRAGHSGAQVIASPYRNQQTNFEVGVRLRWYSKKQAGNLERQEMTVSGDKRRQALLSHYYDTCDYSFSREAELAGAEMF